MAYLLRIVDKGVLARISCHTQAGRDLRLLGALKDFAHAIELGKRSVDGFDAQANIEEGKRLLAELVRVHG